MSPTSLALVRNFAVTDPSLLVSAEERAAWLAGLQQLTDAANACALQVLAAFDANGDGEVLHGARSTVSWLTGALGIAPGDASSRVHLARASRSRLAPVVSLLAEGQLTYDHVRGIGTAVRDLPDEHVASAVDVLADLATRVDVKQLQQAGRHLQDVINPDGALASNQHDFSRRRLHLSPLFDGMVAVDGLLDPESAATLDAALSPFLVPAGKSDDRTTPQRRADGLVELASVAMSQTDLGTNRGNSATTERAVHPSRLDQPSRGSQSRE